MKFIYDTHGGSEYVRSVRTYSRVMILSMVFTVVIVAFSERAFSMDGYYGRMNENNAPSDVTAEITQSPSHNTGSHSLPGPGKLNSILADSHDNGAADTCLPLLSSVRHASPHAAMDRNSQRTAGKAAALGLIFGVRFALSPAEISSKNAKTDEAQVGFWPTEDTSVSSDRHNRSALAVAAYRRCQKQQALKSLNSLRWTR